MKIGQKATETTIASDSSTKKIHNSPPSGISAAPSTISSAETDHLGHLDSKAPLESEHVNSSGVKVPIHHKHKHRHKHAHHHSHGKRSHGEARSSSKKANGSAETKKVDVLPHVSSEHEAIIVNLYSEVEKIKSAGFFSAGTRIYQIVSGKSELRANFITLSREVHILSCLVKLKNDDKQWETLTRLYNTGIPFIGAKIQREIVDCFNKYHMEWKERLEVHHIQLFCQEVQICPTRGGEALKEGDMKTVIELMLAIQD